MREPSGDHTGDPSCIGPSEICCAAPLISSSHRWAVLPSGPVLATTARLPSGEILGGPQAPGFAGSGDLLAAAIHPHHLAGGLSHALIDQHAGGGNRDRRQRQTVHGADIVGQRDRVLRRFPGGSR